MTAIVLLSNADLIDFAKAHAENDLPATPEMLKLLADRLYASDQSLRISRNQTATRDRKFAKLQKLIDGIRELTHV